MELVDFIWNNKKIGWTAMQYFEESSEESSKNNYHQKKCLLRRLTRRFGPEQP